MKVAGVIKLTKDKLIECHQAQQDYLRKIAHSSSPNPAKEVSQ